MKDENYIVCPYCGEVILKSDIEIDEDYNCETLDIFCPKCFSKIEINVKEEL